MDEINDTEEIVVKPLGKHLKGISAFAGATIMGDGRVALILDVLGLAQKARVVSEVRGRSHQEAVLTTETVGEQKQSLLVVAVGEDRRVAIPLAAVNRLEEFPVAAVEWAGGKEAVRYRDSILPLVRLPDDLEVAGHAMVSRDPLQVVVYANDGCPVGLIVDRILDIVEETVVAQEHQHRHGVHASAVIQEKVTDLLDLAELIGYVGTTFVHHLETEKAGA